jgi:hypothetical protein
VFIVPGPLDGDEEKFFVSTSILNAPTDETPDRPSQPLEIAKGKELCEDVRRVKTGNSSAREFEKRIEAALKYIFETDLTAWSSQKVTDFGLSRYDLIARISSEHDVWRMLRESFQSQYVIFECKNYAEQVMQGQIYTTEKYLFLRALRSVAFIISRVEAHESALAAATPTVRLGSRSRGCAISANCPPGSRCPASRDSKAPRAIAQR